MPSWYVTVEPRTLREAIERAEADACSCVVSITRESAEQVRHKEYWAAVDAKRSPSQPKTRTLKLVRNG